MKTMTIVTDITHEDLVCLISTACCSINFLSTEIPSNINKFIEKIKGECREDRQARTLLAGFPIVVCDCYANDESEYYGNLQHFWDKDHMAYLLTLDDIKKGVAKAIDSGGYIREYINHWTGEDGSCFDFTEAEAVMQWIVFGEEIYG